MGSSVVALSTQGATLAAATVAALISATSLIYNAVLASRREEREAQRAFLKERREIHRNSLAPELPKLADALHQVVATSFIQQRELQRGAQTARKWFEKGDAAAKTLAELRGNVRYSLGLDEGIRNLTRVPSWVAHRRGEPAGDLVLEAADKLAAAIHAAVEASWRDGEPPSERTKSTIAQLVVALRLHAPTGQLGAENADDEILNEIDELGAPEEPR